MNRLLRYSLLLSLLLVGMILSGALHGDDSLLVHDLAHAAGGGMVATASDAFMDALKPVPWYTRLAVNVGMAVLVDETYEAGTGKSAGLSWTHNAWAGLAGVAVTGISLRWRF